MVSRPRARIARAAAAIVAAGLLAGACGGGDDSADAVTAIELAPIDAAVLPASVLDLVVTPEPAETHLTGDQQPYIDGLGLFGLRRDELLQATLQVSTFGENAGAVDPVFRNRIAAQVSGSASPALVRVGDHLVYLVPGTRQTIGVWFTDDSMYVLSVRAEYQAPRALVRALVEATVGAEPAASATDLSDLSDLSDLPELEPVTEEQP